MPDFVTCGTCGLRHTLRPDGFCPKCKKFLPMSDIGMGRMDPRGGEIRRQPYCKVDRQTRPSRGSGLERTSMAAFEGSDSSVDAAVAWCREGPPGARVESIEVVEEPPAGDGRFHIR